MKILVAIVLALLGLAILPLNPRVLFSAPGLLLAAISLTLWFLAYRVVTHKPAGVQPKQGGD